MFRNRSDRFALGALTVHFAEMAGQRYERSAARVRRNGLDQLAVTLMLSGNVRGDSAGHDVRGGPGSLCFGDFAQAQALESSDSRTLLLTMPRAVAARRGLDVSALHGTVVGPHAAALLRSHVLAIHAALPDLSLAHRERLAGTVLDLLVVALDEGGARAPAGATARDTAAQLAARRAVEARLDRPGLTIAWLCGELRVSRSTLYRLFEPEGGVTAHIRTRRLACVRLALEAGGPATKYYATVSRFRSKRTGQVKRTRRSSANAGSAMGLTSAACCALQTGSSLVPTWMIGWPHATAV